MVGFEKLEDLYDEDKKEIQMKDLEEYLNIELFQKNRSLISLKNQKDNTKLVHEPCTFEDLENMKLDDDMMK